MEDHRTDYYTKQLQINGNDRGVATRESDPQYMEIETRKGNTFVLRETMKLMPLGNDTDLVPFLNFECIIASLRSSVYYNNITHTTSFLIMMCV